MVLSIAREDGIAVVTLDNPPVNALGRAVRAALWDAAEVLDVDPGVSAVVLICAGRTFVAGADVREFGRPPEPPHLPEVIARIEAAAKPWVAAIHGAALGGGLELALGCRSRIAVAEARMGLPEVTLGIVPGAGGTVRTPRAVGMAVAVEMVTGGRPLSAAKALEAGLIDAVAVGDLRAGAVALARAALGRPWPEPLSARPVATVPEGFWPEAEARVARVAKGASAPGRALACLRRAAEAGFAEAMAFERETFLSLRGTEEAAALRHVFFAERAAPRPVALKGVAARPVASAGVVGGGTMGAGIAAALVAAGLPVVLVERDAAALEAGLGRLHGIIAADAARGRISADQAAGRRALVRGATETAALAGADLVIEAVFEDLEVKRALFARLGAACRADAILATNTSYLDPRDIAAGLPGPERFLGLHFFSPAQVMKLVEVVPTPDTAPEVLAAGFALAARLGKIPVQAGICDGFIGNRILKRYRAAAEALLRAGVGIAAVDGAMRGFGMAMGPFEAQDLGGLDIAAAQRAAARARGEAVPEALGDLLVAAGRKGQKTGGGWYDYAPGSRVPQPSEAVAALLGPHAVPAPVPIDIAARLVAEMAEEGAAILTEGIAAAPADIDLVKIHGYGFPRWRGGPMFLARARGAGWVGQALGRPPSAALAALLDG